MSNRFAYLLAVGVVFLGAADAGAQPAAEQIGALQFVARDGRQFRAQADGAGAVAAAQGKVLANPQNVDVLIALGDAQASIWDHRAAIETYTRALALAPDRAILYQQRGHRRVSNRDFAGGAADLEKATAMDPALSNAWYYLGLTHYVAGRFDRAAECYEKVLALAKDDVVTAMAGVDWLYLSYRRGTQDAKAAALLARVTPDLKVEGNTRLYFSRLLFYKGLKSAEDLLGGQLTDIERTTLNYGVGAFHLIEGRTAEARRAFERAVATSAWPALAFIAAERDLERVG